MRPDMVPKFSLSIKATYLCQCSSRYGHSKVIRLLEQHMGKAGDKNGADATDGRGLLKLKRT